MSDHVKISKHAISADVGMVELKVGGGALGKEIKEASTAIVTEMVDKLKAGAVIKQGDGALDVRLDGDNRLSVATDTLATMMQAAIFSGLRKGFDIGLGAGFKVVDTVMKDGDNDDEPKAKDSMGFEIPGSKPGNA